MFGRCRLLTNIWFAVLFVLTTLFFFPHEALSLSAASDGRIVGTVISEEGNPLPAANVVIRTLERGAITNEIGEYSIPNAPTGTFRVSAELMGYRSKAALVNVRPGRIDTVDFILEKTILEMEPLFITGSPVPVEPLKTPQNISYVVGRSKIRQQAPSLGKTIETIPGIYSISAGAVAGKPVIRGHSGERIRVTSDGVSQEYQQYGERHAANIESFHYDRIEVIKGSASVLYGSDALGGAINLLNPGMPSAPGERFLVRGNVTAGFNSNNSEAMGGIRLAGASRRLFFRGSFVGRNAGNFHAPDETPFSETNKRGDPKFTGEIDHTDYEQYSGTLAAGHTPDFGSFLAAYDFWHNENNFLLPNGNPIGLKLGNKMVSLKANVAFENMILKPRFSYQQNTRQATKPGSSREDFPDSTAVDLVLDVYTGHVEVEHFHSGPFSGTIGAEVKYYDHDNIGSVPLQPDGHYTNMALFSFEEIDLDKVILDVGARMDRRTQKFLASPDNPLLPEDDERDYTSFSGSVGAAYRVTEVMTVTANVSRGFRTPSFYNLYVYGYHGGVFAFQIGNPELDPETTLDLSSSLRYKTTRIDASVTGFYNTVNDYIFMYNDPDTTLAPFVFSHDQEDARISGIEFGVKAHVLDWLLVSGDFSLLESEFIDGPNEGGELPLMPPMRANAEMRFLLPDVSLLSDSYVFLHFNHIGDKDAAGEYEPFGQFDDGIGPDIPFGVASTEAYGLLNAGFGFDIVVGGRPVGVDVQLTNLLDEVYRDFLDTYKGYALGLGRSYGVKINVPIG